MYPGIPTAARGDWRPGFFQRLAADPPEEGCEAEEEVAKDDGGPQEFSDPSVRDAQERHGERDLAPRGGHD